MICKPENKMHDTFTDSHLNTLRRNRNRTLVKMLKLSVWSIIKFLVTQKQPNNIVVIGGACTLYYHRIFAFKRHIRWLKLPNISKLFGHSYLGLIGRNLNDFHFVHTGNIAPKPLLLIFKRKLFIGDCSFDIIDWNQWLQLWILEFKIEVSL